jgi:hypothetical protein
VGVGSAVAIETFGSGAGSGVQVGFGASAVSHKCAIVATGPLDEPVGSGAGVTVEGGINVAAGVLRDARTGNPEGDVGGVAARNSRPAAISGSVTARETVTIG